MGVLGCGKDWQHGMDSEESKAQCLMDVSSKLSVSDTGVLGSCAGFSAWHGQYGVHR